MAPHATPLQQLKEAKQIARDHSLRISERPKPKGGMEYVVYRLTPGGSVRIGKRTSIPDLRHWIGHLAATK